MVVLGICSLVAGLLTFGLPETLGTLLIEHVDEIDNFKRDGKHFCACWSKRTLSIHLQNLMDRKAKYLQEKESRDSFTQV